MSEAGSARLGAVAEAFVTLHVIVRWLILASALIAVALILLARRRDWWNRTTFFWAQAYAWLMGLQSIIGVLLWLSERRWEGGNAFLSFIHPAVMLVAVGIAHGGLSHAYRQSDPRTINRQALWVIVLTFVIVLVTIPWFID